MARLIITAVATHPFYSPELAPSENDPYPGANPPGQILAMVSVSEAETGRPVTGLEKANFRVAAGSGYNKFKMPTYFGPAEEAGYYRITHMKDDVGDRLCIKVSSGAAPSSTTSRVPVTGIGGLKTVEPLHFGQVIVAIVFKG